MDNELIKYLRCSICESVMNTPNRLHPCGHTFCEGCCLSSRACPNCKAKVQARQPDLTAINLISDLTVKCTAKDCPFRGSYQAFMINHKNSCSMRRCGGIQGWICSIKDSLDKNSKERHQQGLIVSNGKGQNDARIQEDEIVMPEAMIMVQDLQQTVKRKEYQGAQQWAQQNKGLNQEQTFIQCIELDHTKKGNRAQFKTHRKTQSNTQLKIQNKAKRN